MENNRLEYTAEMESKIKELDTALQAVKDKFEELGNVKASGEKAVQELVVKKAELKAEMQLATDLMAAKKLLAQVEDAEKDIELQTAINNGQAVKCVGELEELFSTFFAVHAGAGTVFRALDKEYLETMSIRTVEEDTAKMNDFANTVNHAFSVAKRLLIEAGIVTQTDRFYGRVHLGQMELMSKGTGMKREMEKAKRELCL